MRFVDFYRDSRPVISIELFPPKTEKGVGELENRLPKLIALRPSFFTVTYGALGSTRQRTLEIVSRIRHHFGQEVAHHLTCVGASREEITAILTQLQEHKIENIVALRGDPPQGESHFQPTPGGFNHACELVEHIRSCGDFGIAVAGYPEKHIEAPDFDTDLRYLKKKVDAGADVVITQLFYDNRYYFNFVRRCRDFGIDKPVVPGLMPILNTVQIKRITSLCGSEIPEHLLTELAEAGGDERKVHEIGVAYTARQALSLLEKGVPGIHFYVLNQHFHIAEILERIGSALRRDSAVLATDLSSQHPSLRTPESSSPRQNSN
ncbi:MAG: methylenetetrahydrofolate reductase [NAD(P)H] [Acidobacteria bacterium]|nr:methylenetetrahydrofolate reductase [NAD(P)H] [Acidobacteriota bacterium]